MITNHDYNNVSENQILNNSNNTPNVNFGKFSEEKNTQNLSRKSLKIIKKKLVSKEIQDVFTVETKTKNNLNQLRKEEKINDTIVASISIIIIILSFFQLDQLIWSKYKMNENVLTIRTIMIILSIPNGKIVLMQ